VSAVRASSRVAAPGDPVLLSVDIDGENLGYVKLLVGEIDPDANSIRLLDSDYLESARSRLIDGVFYPDWGEGAFSMEFEWEPYVTAVTDAATKAVALFVPMQYGASAEGAVYAVDGTYTFVDGESRLARAYFSNGAMVSAFGYTGDSTDGAPREITPERGDRFTVAETWLDLDAEGKVIAQATEPGQTVTFSNDTLRWTELDAAAGDYVVGFLVEDLDGNQQAAYTRIAVR
jgi:hypothetical protein